MKLSINYIAVPGENDNKRRLSCRAFNQNIPGSTIEDHWDILVMCKLSNIPVQYPHLMT